MGSVLAALPTVYRSHRLIFCPVKELISMKNLRRFVALICAVAFAFSIALSFNIPSVIVCALTLVAVLIMVSYPARASPQQSTSRGSTRPRHTAPTTDRPNSPGCSPFRQTSAHNDHSVCDYLSRQAERTQHRLNTAPYWARDQTSYTRCLLDIVPYRARDQTRRHPAQQCA